MADYREMTIIRRQAYNRQRKRDAWRPSASTSPFPDFTARTVAEWWDACDEKPKRV